jgi:hypothetical protein
MDEQMYLFRIHIRPQGGSADHFTTFDYCIRNGILGVGWRTKSNRNTKNWDKYFKEASKIHKDLNVCNYIKKWVHKGDLVWTRDPEGNYYIAQVISGWEYWTTKEARKLDIDIANVFRCNIKKVSIDDVPGKVVACFRATRTIQEIADDKAWEYSRYLWNVLSKKNVYSINNAVYSDIFMMLDDEETEDIVFLYLQSKGWYVVPNSRKGDTMSFEYICCNPKTGEIAGTQVKTGGVSLDKDDYINYPHKVFLCQPEELYSGKGAKNVVPIQRKELLEFIKKSKSWLPNSLKHKMEIVQFS